MPLNINLASQEKKLISQTNRIISILRNVAIAVIVLFIMLVAAEYGWFFYLTNQKARNIVTINNLTDQLEQQSDIERQYRQAQNIVSTARRIVSSRKNFQDIIANLYNYLPPNVVLTGLNFNQDTVVFDGQSPDVQPFAQALKNFTSLNDVEDDLFGDIALTNISRLRNGNYSFRLEIALRQSI